MLKTEEGKKKNLFTLICLLSINMAHAQNVNIPDTNFKAALINNVAINTNADAEIQVAEATAFTGAIDVYNKGILDLTGIEAFTNLTSLDCSDNFFSSLNVSANTALTHLYCQSCIELTGLDVSANTALTHLYCGICPITSLNVSANTALKVLYCNNNQLTSLDVSANTALTDLLCTTNHLTSLNLSANTALTELRCYYNQLTSLDLSANTALTYLDCEYSEVTSLNVQNGSNVNFLNFYAIGNPNLSCIQVDDVAYSNVNWSAGKDAGASFSTDCGLLSVPAIDKSAAGQIFPNPFINQTTLRTVTPLINATLTVHNMFGQTVAEIKNISGQTATIQRDNLPNGLYFIQLTQDNKVILTNKLEIAH